MSVCLARCCHHIGRGLAAAGPRRRGAPRCHGSARAAAFVLRGDGRSHGGGGRAEGDAAETAGRDAGALENAYRCVCRRRCSHIPCGLCAGHKLFSGPDTAAAASSHYAELLGQQQPAAKQGCNCSQCDRPPLRRATLSATSHSHTSPKPHAQPSSSSQHRTPSTARVPAPRLPCTQQQENQGNRSIRRASRRL